MVPIKKKQFEEPICNIQFNVHKFTQKDKPDDPKKVLIICCFSEFGCEVIGSMYCVPRILRDNPHDYAIVIGWYGRAYLYKHLVDEFWEIKEEFQFLRDKAMAFHHVSKNLSKIEKQAEQFGQVISSDKLGRLAVGNTCKRCKHFWGQVDAVFRCPQCSSSDVNKSLFSDIKYWKTRAVPIPKPSTEKLEQADKYLTRTREWKPIGIIARNRTTYGRNLPPEFYVKLINKLERMYYKPIWMGEKQSTLECPVPGIVDFSRMPESQDLELTLAIISKLEFTLQFWTASTRLSAIMGTPYLIFESPDQLFGQGQEAYRLGLTTTGKKKLVLCHFLNVSNNHDDAIKLIDKCVNEMEANNWNDVIGMVDEPDVVRLLRDQNIHRLADI